MAGSDKAFACPKCGQIIEFGANPCQYCGMPIIWEGFEPPEQMESSTELPVIEQPDLSQADIRVGDVVGVSTLQSDAGVLSVSQPMAPPFPQSERLQATPEPTLRTRVESVSTMQQTQVPQPLASPEPQITTVNISRSPAAAAATMAAPVSTTAETAAQISATQLAAAQLAAANATAATVPRSVSQPATSVTVSQPAAAATIAPIVETIPGFDSTPASSSTLASASTGVSATVTVEAAPAYATVPAQTLTPTPTPKPTPTPTPAPAPVPDSTPALDPASVPAAAAESTPDSAPSSAVTADVALIDIADRTPSTSPAVAVTPSPTPAQAQTPASSPTPAPSVAPAPTPPPVVLPSLPENPRRRSKASASARAISGVFKAIAIIIWIVAAVILGTTIHSIFSLTTAISLDSLVNQLLASSSITTVVVGFVVGLSFFGFGVVISLLNDIRRNIH